MSVLDTLKPSQLRDLAENVAEKETRKAFLQDLKRKLFSVRLDGGAGDDEIFVMTRKLSAAGVWGKVPAHEISFAIAGLNDAVKEVFFEGLEPEYRGQIQEVLVVGLQEAPTAERLNEIVEQVVQASYPQAFIPDIVPHESTYRQHKMMVRYYIHKAGAQTVVVEDAKSRKTKRDVLLGLLEEIDSPRRPGPFPKRSSKSPSPRS